MDNAQKTVIVLIYHYYKLLDLVFKCLSTLDQCLVNINISAPKIEALHSPPPKL
jgi:hypothetical protein